MDQYIDKRFSFTIRMPSFNISLTKMLYACCTHSCCLTALIMLICSTCAAGVMLLSSMYAAYRKFETVPHMCHICAYEGCMCAQKSMPHVCILLYAIHAQWHVCHSRVVHPSTCMLHACGAFQFLCMWHTSTMVYFCTSAW